MQIDKKFPKKFLLFNFVKNKKTLLSRTLKDYPTELGKFLSLFIFAL